MKFISNRYQELTSGGLWINRDVVGPEDKDRAVLMKLNTTDGRNDDYTKIFSTREQLRDYLKGLSTYGRFLRFATDFRKTEGYVVAFTVVTRHNENFIRLTLRDACEFMSRKDYIDNWQSEMHETFTFWSIDECKAELEKVGFVIAPETQAYTNTWIVDNRLKGKVELYIEANGKLEALPYPVTNMILIAEKR